MSFGLQFHCYNCDQLQGTIKKYDSQCQVKSYGEATPSESGSLKS